MNLEVIEWKEKEVKYNIGEKLKSKKWSLQFLPEQLIELSNNKSFNYKNKELKTSYILDIIHNLILKYYFKRENKFNLMSTILKEKYGHLYNYYIDYLVDNSILQMISNYQAGRNARIYKINENILKGKILRYKNSDNILLKKYRRNVARVDDHLLNNKLIDDRVKAKLVNDLFFIDIEFYRSIFYLDNLKDMGSDIYNRNKYSVECINDKHIFYHFDDFGRMHTNFTILKSFIRKNCLLIDGEETDEIDIDNSQPLFLTKIIWDSKCDLINSDEFSLFKYLTSNGKYYKYLMDYLKTSDKKMVKEMTYKVLFGKNATNSKSDKIFKELFPDIHNFIKKYKKEKGDYRVLSYELQRCESNLIFNVIIKDLMIKYPNIKIVTVHDSIIVPRSYKEVATKIFKEKLREEFYFI